MKNRIGIVGGGQLGRMLAEAAKKLGFSTIVLDPTQNGPAAQVADQEIIGSFKDAEKIRELANLSDFVTFEIESANAEALRELIAEGKDINPSPHTLSIIKDKFGQKQFLEKNTIPVAESLAVETEGDIKAAAEKFGYPVLLKARHDAYDGRGNALIREEKEIEAAVLKLNNRSLYVEKFVPFVKELAVIVAREKNGETMSYPAVETIHKNNICHMVISPAPVSKEAAKKAEDLAVSIMSHLNGVGVFAIEMFLTDSGEVLVNEIAPRVHNSGHQTIEGNVTSQFEQHIRAVTGMSLGSVEETTPYAVMINILGERSGPAEPKGVEEAEKLGNVFVHIYGKTETRLERKMGHITVIGDDFEEVIEKAKTARKIISI